MQVALFNEPQKHMVVDDFLDGPALARVLDEFAALEDSTEVGSVVRGRESVLNAHMKKNRNVWLDEQCRDPKSFFVAMFKKRFWSEEMRIALKATNDLLFEYLHHSNREVFLLSAYGDGDFYHEHVDEFPSITANLFVSTAPKRFTGGDLYLFNNSLLDPDRHTATKKIDFVPGRLVLFPSRSRHFVSVVRSQSNAFRDRRFSVQYWATYAAVSS